MKIRALLGRPNAEYMLDVESQVPLREYLFKRPRSRMVSKRRQVGLLRYIQRVVFYVALRSQCTAALGVLI